MEGMCIWQVNEDMRRCEYCSYRGGCENYEKVTPISEACPIYVGIMSGLLGRDILERCRERMLVWARYMVCYQLILDGYSQENIGKWMKMDHSTVCHGKRQVANMLEMPSMYPEEIGLWKKFKELLSLGQN